MNSSTAQLKLNYERILSSVNDIKNNINKNSEKNSSDYSSNKSNEGSETPSSQPSDEDSKSEENNENNDNTEEEMSTEYLKNNFLELINDLSTADFKLRLTKLKNYAKDIKSFIKKGDSKFDIEEIFFKPTSELVSSLDNYGFIDNDINYKSDEIKTSYRVDKLEYNNSEEKKKKFSKLLTKLTICIVSSFLIVLLVIIINFYFEKYDFDTHKINFILLRNSIKAIDTLIWSTYLLRSNVLLSNKDFSYNITNITNIMNKQEQIDTNTLLIKKSIDDMLMIVNNFSIPEITYTSEHAKLLKDNTIEFFILDNNGNVKQTQFSSLIDIYKSVNY